MREQIDSDSLVLLDLPKVVLSLHSQPDFGRGRAKGAGEPHGHLWRYGGFAVEHPRQRDPAHAQVLCRRCYAHLTEILPDHGSGMRGIVHTHIGFPLSVVVLVIDQNRVFALETEGKTPVAADHHRPMAFEVRAQGMQPPSRSVHVFRPAGVVEHEQLNAQLIGVLDLDSGQRAAAEELLQPLVGEALNHAPSVSLSDTGVNSRRLAAGGGK